MNSFKNINLYRIFSLFLVLGLYFYPVFICVHAETIDTDRKYAWSNNAGWINFNPSTGGVTVTSSSLTGYAWSELYGWINFNPSTGGVTNSGNGMLSGYAWGESAGWINFSGVSINCQGRFTGSATGETVGTINFDCDNCAVYTNWRPEYGCGGTVPTHNECSDQQCISVLGSGEEKCQSNQDCIISPVFHNECSDQQCISVSGEGANQCAEDSDCVNATYNECENEKCVLKNGFGFDSCQLDSDCLRNHNECLENQCVLIAGFGANQCVEDSDCANEKHNACVNKNCISVDGAGEDQCQTSSDCQDIPGGPIFTTHNECSVQKKCIKVDGDGQDKCNDDLDCEDDDFELIDIITEPIEDVPEEVRIIINEVKKVINTSEGSVVTKTVSTTGVALATAQLIVFSPFDLFMVIFRMIGIFLTIVGIKKKTKPWGVVYDSITKQPIDPAYVTLKDGQGKVVSSAITDLDGRYGFLISAGNYTISAEKTNYNFPSKKLLGMTEDEFYRDLYFGEAVSIKKDGDVIIKNIPMDPVKFDWNEFAKRDRKLMKFYSRFDTVLRKIFDWFFIVGFIVAVVAYFAAPYPYNLAILFTYIALFVLRIIGIRPRAYGRVLNLSDGDPMSFAVLRVIYPDSNVEVAHKVADKYGRYYCLVPMGVYYIKIEKKNLDGTYSLVHTSRPIHVGRRGIIKETFRI